VTPQPTQTYFAALDVVTKRPGDIVRLFRAWTDAAARLTSGNDVPGDSGETLGIDRSGLTLTFGIGAGLFDDIWAGCAQTRGTGGSARVQWRPIGARAQRR